MVSKARLDLPDPERPVNTISASRGRSREMLRRLCSRAPRTTSRSVTVDIVCWSTDSVRRDAPPRAVRASVSRMTQTEPAATQLDTLRGLVTMATQQLLGDTIAVSDEDWRGPSRLPEWSRGHVASHIARHADGMVRLTEWARSGE